MLNSKQIEALKKLMTAPALQNAKGQPLGVAKHHDGTTFNGNLANHLKEVGLVEFIRTDDDGSTNRTTGVTYKVSEWRITESGKKAL